ncbi:MAG TPA: hypothetical protein VFJ48_03605 [Casimicrobiaceae bacterium]|nr:hypothetical protein [Casimicrobiaceae bacterium]
MTRELPNLILLLYSDPADAATRALVEQAARLPCEILPISLSQLLDEAVIGSVWKCSGRTIDPSRTAVVNRLVFMESDDRSGPLQSFFQREQFWVWLTGELERFAYVSALPSAVSPVGSLGSLADQWSDLPEWVPALRVPEHRRAGDSIEGLRGDVHLVDSQRLYSLGQRAAVASGIVPRGHLAYVRPAGKLFHVAQVGGLFVVPNAPPQMDPQARAHVEAFVRTMAASSAGRILEHAFFEGESVPVFYSTFPIPVVTGRMPVYGELIVRGLQDDIEHRCRRAVA